MKICWATDIHLDFLNDDNDRLIAFCESLTKDSPDAIMLTGDISTYRKLVFHLSALEKIVSRPVHFVLGNHDYYGGSIEQVRKEMKDISNMSQYLRYLPMSPYATLSPATALVGHDGWYDAGYGSVKASNFSMADWSNIKEFVDEGCMFPAGMYGQKVPNYNKIVPLAKKLAHEGVTHMMNGIKKAVRYHSVVLVATHFPPFEEAHIHEGHRGEAGALPWYTNKMCGDMLKQAASAFPKVRFEVFSGHTHGRADVQVSHNLFCHVGGAEYSKPQAQTIINVP